MAREFQCFAATLVRKTCNDDDDDALLPDRGRYIQVTVIQ